MSLTPRNVLLVTHPERASNLASAGQAAQLLDEAGIGVRVLSSDNDSAIRSHPVLQRFEYVTHSEDATHGVELVLVLGGDGTFLRAADLAYAADIPVLGINLGHVGFLAEWEKDSLTEAVHHVIAGDYRIEKRMTIDISCFDASNQRFATGWALNELSVENATRQGVLDTVLEIDQRPVSSFGCDGLIVSTPTGSTAYAFSAGGPVLWPELDAILVVPNNAHALFTKPLVVSPRSTVAIEAYHSEGHVRAVMDGFRRIDIPPNARIEVVQGKRWIQWVRLDAVPFTDRLVRKLHLPVNGWRGPQHPNSEQ